MKGMDEWKEEKMEVNDEFFWHKNLLKTLKENVIVWTEQVVFAKKFQLQSKKSPCFFLKFL